MGVVYVPGIVQEKLEPMNFTINNFSGLAIVSCKF